MKSVLLMLVAGIMTVQSVPLNVLSNDLPDARGLQEDLQDFLALIPSDKIQDIILDYVSTDEDFQITMDYLLSDEFKSLVIEVETFPEVRTLIKHLHESGLDIYTIINQVHDFLGLEHFIPLETNFIILRITGGFPGFINDIRDILPVEDIRALYEKKLKTSADFAALIERLRSPEMQKVIDRLWENDKMKDLIRILEDKGVDVKAILNLVTEIIGIQFPKV